MGAGYANRRDTTNEIVACRDMDFDMDAVCAALT
jgi:hypothetical protein